MKTNILFFSAAIFTLISCSQPTKTIKPGEIWPDNNGVHINAHGGGILYHDGKYYWFGEHKIEGDKGNKAWVGVHCYSSKNLTDWKDEGIALEVVKNDSLSDITEGCVLERPKVIYNPQTKKFVMWFHLELKGQNYDAARSGVAVSDNATGPYQFVRSFRPNAGYWPKNVQEIHKQPVPETTLSKYCGGKGCLPAHPDTVNLLGRDFDGGQMARDQNLLLMMTEKLTTFILPRKTVRCIFRNSPTIIYRIQEITSASFPVVIWKRPPCLNTTTNIF